jgi:hypothetical protein
VIALRLYLDEDVHVFIAERENPSQNIRVLLNLLALVSIEEMADQLEYLNFWT